MNKKSLRRFIPFVVMNVLGSLHVPSISIDTTIATDPSGEAELRRRIRIASKENNSPIVDAMRTVIDLVRRKGNDGVYQSEKVVLPNLIMRGADIREKMPNEGNVAGRCRSSP